MEDGKIKFHCEWLPAEPILSPHLDLLNHWRNRLHQYGLIGVYPNGISFGNISIRESNSKQFIITGTGTGSLVTLEPKHYTEVVGFDLTQNAVTCRGPVKASSESLSHAAVYQACSELKAVIHIHHLDLWNSLYGVIPTTNSEVEYGTPGMALEILRLFQQEATNSHFQILVMGGHPEGIITFGKDLDEAGSTILQRLNDIS